MRTGTILRGCDFKEEKNNEQDMLEMMLKEKVNDLSSTAQSNMDKLLGAFTDSMCLKIEDLEQYKDNLKEEYAKEVGEIKEKSTSALKDMELEYERTLKKQEADFKEFLENTHNDIKELMLILFEKFFFTQYKEVENIDSLIKEGLRQLEDSASVKISLNKELFNAFSEEQLENIKNNTDAKLEFSSHSKENLLIKLESEKETIEADFNKQIEKVKKTILSF